MALRKQLRDHLATAWRETIEGPYRAQQINSERGLQVHFCVKLLPMFEGSSRRLFIEPRIRIEGREKPVFPDILVCSQRAVIAAIELKYVPRGRPATNGDLAKLRAFVEPNAQIEVANERFRGRRLVPIKYKLAKNALVCWAAIYTGNFIDLKLGDRSRMNGRLLTLHAITKTGHHAKLSVGAVGDGDA